MLSSAVSLSQNQATINWTLMNGLEFSLTFLPNKKRAAVSLAGG